MLSRKETPVETYEVQSIVNEFFDGKRILYEVKWKGYSHDQNTWEPLEHLQEVPEMIQEWKDSQREMKNNCLWEEEESQEVFQLENMAKLKKPQKGRIIKKQKEIKKGGKIGLPKKKTDENIVCQFEKRSFSTEQLQFRQTQKVERQIERPRETKSFKESKPKKLPQEEMTMTKLIRQSQKTPLKDGMDEKNELRLILENKKLRKELGIPDINPAKKDSVIIIVEESLSEEADENQSNNNAEAAKKVTIPKRQNMATSTQMRQMLTKARKNIGQEEVKEQYIEDRPEEVKEQYIEDRPEEARNFIQDDIDSVPELPKMTEKNPENNIDFFQDPNLVLEEDVMDTSEIEYIEKIFKEDDLVLCSVVTKDNLYIERVGFDLIEKKRSDLVKSFFNGRCPFK